MRGDERRRRRRHLEDRGVRRRQGDRCRRARCRRAASLPRARRHKSCASRRPGGASPPSSASTSTVGAMLTLDQGARHRAALMADRLFEAMEAARPPRKAIACCAPIRSPIAAGSTQCSSPAACPSSSTATRAKKFGDLGPLLAAEIRARVETFCPQSRAIRSKASAPPWSARRNTPSSSAAARSTCRRSMRCRCATCR